VTDFISFMVKRKRFAEAYFWLDPKVSKRSSPSKPEKYFTV